MKNSLLQNLIAFYEEEPNDPFNIYALALEYQKTDVGQAELYFNKLLAEHPDYLATYYSAGAFFAGLEKNEKAAVIYQKGIDLALDKKDTKTHQELVRAYRSFLDELED
ncbi:tetratricopeptide repeat protein [Dyadobacter sp. LHD-138]|uniref:tetratricopeptide repeat protein n=1 Tax=Dyadobacter sp. LHD-138 TaxID=3071413 RepID=UPI0027E0B79B|nr:tetratricopeptide repeat protein [Dyadobacter sp. LHD-138]MDQ6480230.1 tetratricopeptide repeat protein [Dyadobacter sp. LHD-138]